MGKLYIQELKKTIENEAIQNYNTQNTMNDIEKKALALIQTGMSAEDIEKKLQSEFVFFRDPMTNKYISATQWE